MKSRYLFCSDRLGFRNWLAEDLKELSEMNADREVMAFFPGIQSRQDSADFIERMQALYQRTGFCYFAVEVLKTQEFIGFTGLSEQTFEAEFTPCVDIGWRLKRSAWNSGYATEGAKACLKFAFEKTDLKQIYAIAPAVNTKSEAVMKKIGMHKTGTFLHPKLRSDKWLQECVLYSIK